MPRQVQAPRRGRSPHGALCVPVVLGGSTPLALLEGRCDPGETGRSGKSAHFVTSTKPGPLPRTIQDTPDMGHLATFAQTSQGFLLQLAGARKATPVAP